MATYFGSYYATVDRGVVIHLGMWSTFPAYDTVWQDDEGTIDELAQSVFGPAHSLDCMLRPEYWGGGSITDGSMPTEFQGANFY
jgi:hypothetical protein